MAWEWVAPLATGLSGAVGVAFTWLAGAQGREHAERMVEQTHAAENRTWLRTERRDAYLAALSCVELIRRRARYRAQGKTDKLQQLDEYWPKPKRVQMEMDALIALRAFGSERVVELDRMGL